MNDKKQGRGRFVRTIPAQQEMRVEFESLLRRIKSSGYGSSNTFVGELVGHDRNWIERRLPGAKKSIRTDVGVGDIFAMRYVAQALLILNRPAYVVLSVEEKKHLSTEFSSLVDRIKSSGYGSSNTFVGELVGHDRNWIERRLPNAPVRVDVGSDDVFAMRYVAEALVINQKPARVNLRQFNPQTNEKEK